MGITGTTRGSSRRFPLQNRWISYPQLHTLAVDTSSPHVPIHAQAPIYQQPIHDRGEVFPNIVRMLFHNPHHLSTGSARLSTFTPLVCRIVTFCARLEPVCSAIHSHLVGVDLFLRSELLDHVDRARYALHETRRRDAFLIATALRARDAVMLERTASDGNRGRQNDDRQHRN